VNITTRQSIIVIHEEWIVLLRCLYVRAAMQCEV